MREVKAGVHRAYPRKRPILDTRLFLLVGTGRVAGMPNVPGKEMWKKEEAVLPVWVLPQYQTGRHRQRNQG